MSQKDEQSMNSNILQILGVQNKEDAITNVICNGINKSPGFRNAFLQHICNVPPSTIISVEAITRLSTFAAGIPDLVIKCTGEKRNRIIIIENKLKAEEGVDQTKKYSSVDSINNLKKILNMESDQIDVSLIFLTLFPDQQPKSENFVHKTHSDLLNINNNIYDSDEIHDLLIRDWISMLGRFYSRENIDPEDLIQNKLRDDSELDSGYLYFRSFFKKIDLPNNLVVKEFFRTSQKGRHYYGAIISKNLWCSNLMERIDDKYDIEDSFNIHFEPQYDVLNKRFNLFLHYEVNPYETNEWVQKNATESSLDKYEKRRMEIRDKLKKANPKDWLFTGGTNQIAKIPLKIGNRTTLQVEQYLINMIQEMSNQIDAILINQ